MPRPRAGLSNWSAPRPAPRSALALHDEEPLVRGHGCVDVLRARLAVDDDDEWVVCEIRSSLKDES